MSTMASGDVVLAISICICQSELGPHSRLIAMELVGPREIRRRYGEMLLAGSGHLVNTTADCCSACLQYQPSGDHQEAVCNGEREGGAWRHEIGRGSPILEVHCPTVAALAVMPSPSLHPWQPGCTATAPIPTARLGSARSSIR